MVKLFNANDAQSKEFVMRSPISSGRSRASALSDVIRRIAKNESQLMAAILANVRVEDKQPVLINIGCALGLQRMPSGFRVPCSGSSWFIYAGNFATGCLARPTLCWTNMNLQNLGWRCLFRLRDTGERYRLIEEKRINLETICNLIHYLP